MDKSKSWQILRMRTSYLEVATTQELECTLCPHEAHKDMASHTRPTYQQQAETVYTDLKEEIGEDNMEVIMATQMCGK